MTKKKANFWKKTDKARFDNKKANFTKKTEKRLRDIEEMCIGDDDIWTYEISNLLQASKELENWWIFKNLLKRDNELLELVSIASVKFAKQITRQITLKAKDVDILNKLSNTALKRQALIAAALSRATQQEAEPEKPVKPIIPEIKITI